MILECPLYSSAVSGNEYLINAPPLTDSRGILSIAKAVLSEERLEQAGLKERAHRGGELILSRTLADLAITFWPLEGGGWLDRVNRTVNISIFKITTSLVWLSRTKGEKWSRTHESKTDQNKMVEGAVILCCGRYSVAVVSVWGGMLWEDEWIPTQPLCVVRAGRAVRWGPGLCRAAGLPRSTKPNLPPSRAAVWRAQLASAELQRTSCTTTHSNTQQ